MKKLCAFFLLAALIAMPAPLFLRAHAQCAREIFLTFDDGPTDSVTPLVLDTLLEKGVRATFFVIGRQIRGREDILRRIDGEGHALGIHSYTHRYKEIYRSEEALLQDIAHCRAAIRRVLPYFSAKIYRFPGGSFLCPRYRETVQRAGYIYYDWNAASGDGEGRFSASELYERSLATARGKARVVLLMHDGVGCGETAKALPAVIDAFLQSGYAFKTLPPQPKRNEPS